MKLFTPCNIGPVELRNRTIRSAAFEGMCKNNGPTQQLQDYHVSVAKGGVGMTTLAYASICESGLSFKTQLLMSQDNVRELRKITEAIHATGAKASVQIGHCGNMTHISTAGCIPVGATTGFNLYSPTIVRGLQPDELHTLASQFGDAVVTARDAGFDCVEVHAGHGYLISQFLSPYTNRRNDQFGGSAGPHPSGTHLGNPGQLLPRVCLPHTMTRQLWLGSPSHAVSHLSTEVVLTERTICPEAPTSSDPFLHADPNPRRLRGGEIPSSGQGPAWGQHSAGAGGEGLQAAKPGRLRGQEGPESGGPGSALKVVPGRAGSGGVVSPRGWQL